MTHEKWEKFLKGAHYPESLTSQDARRVAEAKTFTRWAMKGVKKTSKVLVLGCGDGYEVKLVHLMGYNVRGITFLYSEKELEGVKAQGMESFVDAGDIHEMPYKDEEFDYVLSKETLEHLLSPFMGLCEINRVMKVGGKFVHCTPTGEMKQRDWNHYHCAPDWMWIDLMYKAGFEVTRTGYAFEQPYYKGLKRENKNL